MKLVNNITIKIKEIKKIIFALRNIYTVGIAVLKGTLYIIWHRIFSRDVIIRFPFMVYAPVKIIGDGTVFIDGRCSVFYNKHNGLTIHTLYKNAKVSIGKGCDLGGVTIRCNTSITIGDRTMTAFSLVQDVFIVNSLNDYSKQCYKEKTTRSSIIIGNHVWLGGQSCVLGGADIGDGCVLSVNSCIFNAKTKEDCLLIGNPIKRGMPINSLIKFKGI